MLARLPRKCQVQLLQVRPSEVEGYSAVHSNTQAIESPNLVEGLLKLEPHSFVIIEDIVIMTKKEEESLRYLLNYRAHHDSLRVICVAHMLYRTMLCSLVPMFNYIAFTHTNTNRGLIQATASRGFNLDPSVTGEWLAAFSRYCSPTNGKAGEFFFVSCTTVEFFRADGVDKSVYPISQLSTPLSNTQELSIIGTPGCSSSSSSSGAGSSSTGSNKKQKNPALVSLSSSPLSTGEIEKRFANCFVNHEQASQASALFSIISGSLIGEPSFRHSDLSMAFSRSSKPSTLKRVSVVDYVCSLLDSKPRYRPSLDHLVMHRFLSTRVKIPKLFIRNPHFHVVTTDITSDECDDDDDDDV